MKKEKAILFGPSIMEFGWETIRFSGLISHYKNIKYRNQKDIKYIVLTRKERFDLWGQYANILIPLNIEGDYGKYVPNCYCLNHFPISEYKKIIKNFKKKYSEKYQIIEHIYPGIEGRRIWQNKNLFPKSKVKYKFKPRIENYKLVDDFIGDDQRPIIIIGPRFRKGFKRNWTQWQELYDRICHLKLDEKYNFIIAGKEEEHIPDKRNRFKNINDIEFNSDSSLVGVLIVLMEISILTVGSQSAIPNLSLLCKCPVLEWGHEKILHSKVYNSFNTPVVFLNDPTYQLNHRVIINEMQTILRTRKIK
jgi:hypothetical protein